MMRIDRRRILVLATGMALLLGGAGGRASAAFVVAPNANTTTAGGMYQLGIFGNGSASAYVFQIGFAASQFAAVPVGSQITSVGFRLGSGVSTVATALNYSQFDVQIGRAAQPIGSLSTTFASNLGADTITARSGALTIQAGSFVGGSTVNPFYDLTFATPYTYTGGDLLITIRDTLASSSTIPSVALDAVNVGGVDDTVGDVGGSSTDTTGFNHFFNAPVTRLGFSAAAAVPEPSSLALCGVAALVGLVARARRGAR